MGASQLAAWERIALGWPVSREAETYRCGDCGKGIALAMDSMKREYRYTHEQILAHIVLHLRNHHANLDPDVA